MEQSETPGGGSGGVACPSTHLAAVQSVLPLQGTGPREVLPWAWASGPPAQPSAAPRRLSELCRRECGGGGSQQAPLPSPCGPAPFGTSFPLRPQHEDRFAVSERPLNGGRGIIFQN